MKNKLKEKLKELNEISEKQSQVRLDFEKELEKIIKNELNIDIELLVCHHGYSYSFSIFDEKRNIDIKFYFVSNTIENQSKKGHIKISQKIIKLINNLFK